MPLLFALTLFASAALSFLVQPLIGRQLLPLAGGTPAVWTTCLVFFQIMLLAGYFYAHWLSAKSMKFAVLFHACVFAAAGVAYMLEREYHLHALMADEIETAPVAALTISLALSVGLPYFALATTAPLLQAWFARGGRSPYWLYAASNAGSLIGLLAYPFLVEPFFPLAAQTSGWSLGFIAVWLLTVFCGCSVAEREKTQTPVVNEQSYEPISVRRRLKWLAMPALTTSLLASVTAHLSTDIAPMPLLWVVPLALYLLTFIVTFSHWSDRSRKIIGRVAPMAICFTTVALLAHATEPLVLVAAVHLVGLTAVCLLCHGELAADKPDPKHVTDFYLCLALGGVAGGAFNAVLAPFVFSNLGPIEYPLALVLAAMVRPGRPLFPWKAGDLFAPLGVLTLTVLLGRLVPRILTAPNADDEADQLLDRVLRGGLLYGVPTVVTFALVWRPLRFALCLAAVLTAGLMMQARTNYTLEVSRNFFGTLTVTLSDDGRYMVLTHGTTRHGQQRVGEEHPEPAMYYHRKGPLGGVFQTPARRVGVVGLGCGAMAAYAEPGQHWTFFEIDPGVVRLAKNKNYFTFLETCRAESLTVVLGDARRKLNDLPDGSFDLLAIDAFNSDAVPVHLLTKEAFELYLRKLAPNGRLILHVSNRYLDLPSLAARVALSVEPTLAVKVNDDRASDYRSGKWASVWVAIARSEADLGKPRFFAPLRGGPGPVWTDDYAPLLGVWKSED